VSGSLYAYVTASDQTTVLSVLWVVTACDGTLFGEPVHIVWLVAASPWYWTFYHSLPHFCIACVQCWQYLSASWFDRCNTCQQC
jgi:hypothetical protein